MIEIMLVVMIIVLLLGFAISQMGGNIDIAREARVKGDVQSVKTQLMIYESQNGDFPSTEQGLRALITKPEGASSNWRQLMEELPKDPYGKAEYLYMRPGKHNPNSYDLYSVGKDHLPDTADDIGNWK
jgi:general secretion pathway protein G